MEIETHKLGEMHEVTLAVRVTAGARTQVI